MSILLDVANALSLDHLFEFDDTGSPIDDSISAITAAESGTPLYEQTDLAVGSPGTVDADGSGSFLLSADGATRSEAPWTVIACIKMNSVGVLGYVWHFGDLSVSSNQGVWGVINVGGALSVQWFNSGFKNITTSTPIVAADETAHIAVTVDGLDWNVYKNGVLFESFTGANAIVSTNQERQLFAGTNVTPIDILDGSMAYFGFKDTALDVYDIRALYMAAVDTEDMFIPDVVSLLRFEGADASTDFIDETGLTWNEFDNAQIDTANPKYGNAAGLFDGSGDYLTQGSVGDWNFLHDGTTDYTIELFYDRDAADPHYLLSTANGGTADIGIFIRINADGSIDYRICKGSGGSYELWALAPAGSAGINAYEHLAIVYVASTRVATIFVDGVAKHSDTGLDAASASDHNLVLTMGKKTTVAGQYFDGHIDEQRITTAARYTDDFTPPTAAHPYPAEGVGTAAGTSVAAAVGEADSGGEPVPGDIELVWDVEETLAAVPGDIELVWNVLAFINGTFEVSWHVDALIGGEAGVEFGLGWDVEEQLELINGEFSISWNVIRIQVICRAYRVLSDKGGFWKGFSDKSAIMTRGPLVNDKYNRYYIVQDDEAPQYTTYDVLDLERRRRLQLVESKYLRLGVPRPANAPVVVTEGGTEDLTVDRAYIYTFLSAYGEEGPPSDPASVSGADDGTWTLSGFDHAPEFADDRRITGIRIYRTVTGTLGTVAYHYVTDINIETLEVLDVLSTAIVGANTTLESTDYYPPPAGLRGIVEHPNGFFIGFDGRDIYFSEPYRPHAWPPKYIRSTLGDVVGLGIFGTSVVVCTESFPYVMTGIAPEGMVLTQNDTAEPCLSRYGIVSMPQGVYFPGPNGLVMASSRGFDTITEKLITREEWQSRYDPDNIDAARYQNSYVAFYSQQRGFLFTPTDALYTFVELNEFWDNCGIQTDEYSGKVLLCTGDELYEWNPPTGANVTYVWESKEFDVPDPKNFGAFRIIHYGDPVPTDAEIQYWRDYNALRILDPLSPVAHHALGIARKDYVDDGVNDTPEWRQPIGGPVLNPVPDIGDPWPNEDTLTAEFFANDRLVHTKVVPHTKMLRLPSGFKATRWRIRLTGEAKVKTVKMAETGKELSRV